MLKIITSVVLTLVTIMALTLYVVTVPAQQHQIDDNAAAIASNKTYIKTVEDAFDVLDAKKLYQHYISISSSNDFFIYVQFVSSVNMYSIDSFIEYLKDNEITEPESAIGVTGRIYSNNLGSFTYGLYTSNDDLYVVNIATTNVTITSALLENVVLSDYGILLN